MKSYFIFLKRNKAYSAINLIGLSISLMFLLLIGCYVWQETHMDRWQSNADNIYALCYVDSSGTGDTLLSGAWAMQHSLRHQFPEIVASCAIADPTFNTIPNPRSTGSSDKDIKTNFLMADSSFFSVFDYELAAGDRHTVMHDPRSAVVTEEFGRKLFGDESPMGKTISLDGDSASVVVTGVMKPWKNTVLTANGQQPDMVVRFELMRFFNPTHLSPTFNNASGDQVFLVGRDGDDLRSHLDKYNAYMQNIHWLLNPATSSMRLGLVPLTDMHFANTNYAPCVTLGDASFVQILLVAGIIILVFALINYVNLTMAQASWRAREMATRRLMGASKAGVMCRLAAESLVMVAMSLALAVALASTLAPAASHVIGASIDLAELLSPVTMLAITATALLLGLSAGIIPALFISAAKPIDVVRGTFRSRVKSSYSRVFIIVQNTVTIIMIIAAFTIYKQTRALIEAPLGFDYEGVAIINGPGNMAQPLKSKLMELSCVECVSLSNGNPIDGGNNNTVTIDDRMVSNQIILADSNLVRVYGIEIESDNGSDGVFVNHQLLAEHGLPENATHIKHLFGGAPISGTFKDFRIRNILANTRPMVIGIVPDSDLANPWSVNIKTVGDKQHAWEQIKNVFADISGGADLDQWVKRPFADDIIKENFEKEERLAQIMAMFAIVAVLISVLGLVAMSTYYVQQRRREIAIRKVYGSTSGEVLWRLLRSFSTNVLASMVIGFPVAWLLMSDWLAQYAYRTPLSWWIFAGTGALCLAISIMAVLVQSRHAANANPAISLYSNN